MASVEDVRAEQGAWADKEVVVTLKSGKKVAGTLDPLVLGAFIVGDQYVPENEVDEIVLTHQSSRPGVKIRLAP